MKIRFLTFLILCLPFLARAEGSLPASEVIALLKQDTVLWEELLQHYEFDEIATGVRLGRHWPQLGGARISPYTLKMKRKGAAEFSLILQVECSPRFFSEAGDLIPLEDDGSVSDRIIREAARFEEVVKRISISSEHSQ